MSEPIGVRPLLILTVLALLAGLIGVVAKNYFGNDLFGLWAIAGVTVVVFTGSALADRVRERRSRSYHRSYEAR